MNLTIHGGEFIVLTGSSGCGKTTVCRLINGLIPHYFEGERQGEVLIEGTDVAKEPIYDTARLVGSVFQNPRSQFFNVDTTSELAFSAENQGRDPEKIRQDIDKASDMMGLSPLLNRSMFKLSGGEKQKIACGTVAVADPSII
ncbi:MAG: ABC transporter ATP-binding protein, partial [Clostridia bacterium]